MVVNTKEPTKQQIREIPRWRRVLALHEGEMSDAEIATREDVLPKQVRRLIEKAKIARANHWI